MILGIRTFLLFISRRLLEKLIEVLCFSSERIEQILLRRSLIGRKMDFEHPEVLEDVVYILALYLELIRNPLRCPVFGILLVVRNELYCLSKRALSSRNFSYVWFMIAKIEISDWSSIHGKWFLGVDLTPLLNLK